MIKRNEDGTPKIDFCVRMFKHPKTGKRETIEAPFIQCDEITEEDQTYVMDKLQEDRIRFLSNPLKLTGPKDINLGPVE